MKSRLDTPGFFIQNLSFIVILKKDLYLTCLAHCVHPLVLRQKLNQQRNQQNLKKKNLSQRFKASGKGKDKPYPMPIVR